MHGGRAADDHGHRGVRRLDGVHLQLAAAGHRSPARPRPLRHRAAAPDLRGHARRRAAGAKLADPMNKMAKYGLLVLAWIGCTTAARATAPKTAQDADYDRLVDAVVARYHLPGIAVGVIENGKVTYMRGVGELADTGRPIDPDTLFKIASNSKAMTATVL